MRRKDHLSHYWPGNVTDSLILTNTKKVYIILIKIIDYYLSCRQLIPIYLERIIIIIIIIILYKSLDIYFFKIWYKNIHRLYK